MGHRTLGRTGVDIAPRCRGTVMLDGRGKENEAESMRIVHRVLDAGINLADTAERHARGETHGIVGRALAARSDNVVLATTFHGPMGDVEGVPPVQVGLERAMAAAHTLVVRRAGVPHARRNKGSAAAPHISAIAPEPDRGDTGRWDVAVELIAR